ncbi:MAG TPA: Gfo/Idh/MocA family oxidoreductase, partial [Vicinamibacterales bacterium]|nr:Gfo/Idh/MocA family oxidoreductase [Vicinamibacterales bacterium]
GRRQTPAAERVVVGFIGVGGMGRATLRNFLRMPEVRVAAVCDVWEHNRALAARITADQPGGAAEAVADFRRVLDRKDIDAVVISTPDHWHAIPTVLACEAGKDVYVEKPLAHNIREGRKMVEAARRHRRVVQMGTQQRSGEHYREAVALLREGRIGRVTRVACWNLENVTPHGIGSPADTAPPPGLDWDLYLGPAPKVPFNPNRFIGTFRWFWDYAGGMMTDWGVHHIDIIHWAMDVRAPLAAAAAGGKFHLTDNRETPDTLEAVYEYPGFVMTYSHRALNARAPWGRSYGIEFYGTDGTLFLDRGGYEIFPEAPPDWGPPEPQYLVQMREASTPPPIQRRRLRRVARTALAYGEGSEQNLSHIRNFLDCLKSRERPVSDVEIGHLSTAAAHLGNVAFRTGRKIRWDAEGERVVGDEEANRLLGREYRAPWTL